MMIGIDSAQRLINAGYMKLRLKEIRHRLGLTQEQASERCLVTSVSMSRHETGAGGWTSHTIAQYAAGYDVPEYEIFGYDIPPTIDLPSGVRELLKVAVTLEADTASDATRLLRHFRSLPPRDRETVVQLAEIQAKRQD